MLSARAARRTHLNGEESGPRLARNRGDRVANHLEWLRQPTPTSMISAEDIQLDAAPNVFDTIAELPVLQGSTGRRTFVNSTSSGATGLSSFSLRNLGTIRTLTLLDGQRVTPANVTGVVDVSQFPQLLVKRVDVVTGGASASYGSDAIGGVVNFITDKEFVGLKTNVEAGPHDLWRRRERHRSGRLG